MNKPKIVIFDEENKNVICEEPTTVVAFLCNASEVKTIICGNANDVFIDNLSRLSSQLIKDTYKEEKK